MDATFHAGERGLQAGAGSAQRLAQAGPRVIRDHMPQQHRDFFALLPFIVAGALDGQGQPWASFITGPAGFVQSPAERSLRIGRLPAAGDPLNGLLRSGAPVGLLGIQPHTRRRNRMNGRITQLDGEGLSVAVAQSFGNCPKYIQAREAGFDVAALPPGPPERIGSLDGAAGRIIRGADTLFIASAHPQACRPSAAAHGVDVSHRGGKPGFVHVEGNALLLPDFAGNAFFNTLGNLQLEPRCGLLFTDFEGGEALWLAARATLVEAGPVVQRFAGAQRVVRLEVTGGLRRERAFPLRWGPAQPAPELAATGHW